METVKSSLELKKIREYKQYLLILISESKRSNCVIENNRDEIKMEIDYLNSNKKISQSLKGRVNSLLDIERKLDILLKSECEDLYSEVEKLKEETILNTPLNKFNEFITNLEYKLRVKIIPINEF